MSAIPLERVPADPQPFRIDPIDPDAASANGRLDRVLARVRRRQLRLALAGDVIASHRYAERARTLRGLRHERRAAAAVLLAAALLFGVTAPVAAQAPPRVVRAGDVRQELVQQHQRVTGTLRAVSRAAVAAQEEGAVLRVLVDEGDVVTRGQVLAEFDARRLTAQLAEAEAEITAAEAQVAEREAELVRLRRDAEKLAELRSSNAATRREYDDALTAVQVGEAQLETSRRQVEQARQRVALLQIRLEDTRIVAPFDGRVVERHVEPGVWVRPGDAVATIVSTGLIEAWLEVPERLSEAVRHHADRLSVTVDADGQARPSMSVRAVPLVDPRVRTFAVIVELDNADASLSPGMSVSAWVPMGESAVRITVPKDAVVRTPQGALVYRAAAVAGEDGRTAEAVPVRVLFETTDRVVVASDRLASDDVVVVEGNERLMPATPVVLAE